MQLDKAKMKLILEGALMASGEALTLNRLASLFSEEECPDNKELKALLAELAEDYQERSLELKEIASGYIFRVRQEYSPWLVKLWQERPPRYSRAVLETLALIAYRQPITRAEIEEVRGVSVSSHIIKGLSDRGWIRVVGHKDVPGKPSLFATTKEFLDYFNLKNLEELPPLAQIKDLEKVAEQLQLDLELERQDQERGQQPDQQPDQQPEKTTEQELIDMVAGKDVAGDEDVMELSELDNDAVENAIESTEDIDDESMTETFESGSEDPEQVVEDERDTAVTEQENH